MHNNAFHILAKMMKNHSVADVVMALETELANEKTADWRHKDNFCAYCIGNATDTVDLCAVRTIAAGAFKWWTHT